MCDVERHAPAERAANGIEGCDESGVGRSSADEVSTTAGCGDSGDADDLDVAIVGGGICGLTTALALERRGIEPTVYEAATEYRPVGAGISLQTNATLVFARLGIADRIREAGAALDRVTIRSSSGRTLQRFDATGVERDGIAGGFVAIHRGALLEVLRDALSTDVVTDMPCVAIPSTDPPAARFEDGTTVRPDVLVGADGIDSAVRDAVVDGIDPRPLSTVAYRAVVPVDLPARTRTLGGEVWGRGTYTGGAPIDDDRFYWFATAPDSLVPADADPEARLAALRDRLSSAPEPIPTVMDALEPDAIIRSALADLPALDRWHRDRVALAGDAAHAMLPFAGQGAAQGIEDALALADALATGDDPAAALAAYERERKPRADRIRAESRRLGSLSTVESRAGTTARNLAAAMVPTRLADRLRRRRLSNPSLLAE